MRVSLIFLFCFVGLLRSYSQDGFTPQRPKLAYWQVGQAAQTVIVLHGGPAAPHQYLRPEFDALSQTAKVIYYDQRGCGKSDTANFYRWEDHVDDLHQLIRVVSSNQRVFLIGSSWGSMLALLYAYTYPNDVKGLILTGTLPWYGRESIYQRKRFEASEVVPVTIQEKRLSATNSKPAAKRSFDTLIVSKRAEVVVGIVQSEPLDSRDSAPKAERLSAIKQPVLLINGTYNRPWDWAEEYAKLLPNLEVHTIVGAGHDPWFSNPELFFQLSNQFILTHI